jgi:hemerythrin-like metal-binding protein
MTEWTPDLSTGVSVLDEQHKAIFQWLAQLESASAEQRTLFGVYVLTRLKHHMREHFATEEAMMKAVGYPDLARHQAEHAVFRTRLEELQLKSIAQDISADTVHFQPLAQQSHCQIRPGLRALPDAGQSAGQVRTDPSTAPRSSVRSTSTHSRRAASCRPTRPA